MKNRHLVGALIVFAPVIAIAQVGTTPPVGNASETVGNGPATSPLTQDPVGPGTVDTTTVPDTATDSSTVGTADPQSPETTPPETAGPQPRG